MDGIGYFARRFNDKWWLKSSSSSDVVICSSGSVKRFWITSYSVNWNAGTAVAGATCTQSADKSVMTFTRNLVPDGGSENLSPITH